MARDEHESGELGVDRKAVQAGEMRTPVRR
jgi:hypothetical protein